MLYVLLGGDIIMLGLTALRFSSIPPQLPLFYSQPFGEDQLVDWWMIFVLPIIMNLLYFINSFVYKKYFPGNEFVKKIIDYLNIFICISFTLIFIKIILLVT
jgi:hypothetical protein